MTPSGIINIGDPHSRARRVTYLELSNRHFFVCWGGSLYVYLRPDVPGLDFEEERYHGGDQVYRLTSDSESWFGPWYVQLRRLAQQSKEELARNTRSMRRVPLMLSYQHTLKFDEFVAGASQVTALQFWLQLTGVFRAVHSLPDSSVVVAVTLGGTCMIISDFNAVARGKIQTRNAIIVVDIWSGSADSFRYISYDYENDRIAISTVSFFSLLCKRPVLTARAPSLEG